MPLILALFSMYRFKNHTYSFLHLCRRMDDVVLVSFYNHNDEDKDMLDFISRLYTPETNRAGFIQH
jgi:hypothetical protein